MSLDPMPDEATLLRVKEEREFAQRERAARVKTGRMSEAEPGRIFESGLLGRPTLAPRTDPPDPYARMNRTEKLWAERLEAQKRAGTLAAWYYEAVTFKLAHDVRYTPDFLLIYADGRVAFDEVKGGHIWDDAKAKVRIAARLYPFPFRLAQKRKGAADFTVTVIAP